VFLTRKGLCKLGDFGISRVLNGTRSRAKTLVGTPFYLSPEILCNNPYNMKSDIWALGVLLYELTAVRRPFDAKDLPTLGRQIIHGKYPSLPEGYSQALKNIVALCLQKNPSQRPTIHSILNMPVI